MENNPEISDEEIISIIKDLNSTNVEEIANIIKASHTYTFNRLANLVQNGLINLHKKTTNGFFQQRRKIYE